MAFCSNCGKELEENVKFCPSCGNQVSGEPKTEQTETQGTYTAPAGGDFADKFNEYTKTEDKTAEFDPMDISNNKVYAVLSYISILFLVPLLAAPKSKFARFHANQGLVLFIISMAYGIVTGIIRAILKSFTIILGFNIVYHTISAVLGLGSLLLFVLAIIGIIHAAQGEAKELPVIGKINILK